MKSKRIVDQSFKDSFFSLRKQNILDKIFGPFNAEWRKRIDYLCEKNSILHDAPLSNLQYIDHFYTCGASKTLLAHFTLIDEIKEKLVNYYDTTRYENNLINLYLNACYLHTDTTSLVSSKLSYVLDALEPKTGNEDPAIQTMIDKEHQEAIDLIKIRLTQNLLL